MASSDPATIAAAAAALLASRRRRRALAWGAAAVLVAVTVLLMADASADLPPLARRLGLGAAVLLGVGLAVTGLRRPAGDPLRAAEAALDDGDRRLTAARELAGVDDLRATTQADRLMAAVPATWDADLAQRLPPTGWRGPALVAGGAVAALAAGAAFLPFLLAVEIPRLVDPDGDHPPYAATRLWWIEPPAAARFGEPLVLTVEATGTQPSDLHLVSAAQAGADFLPAGGNRWRVRLEPPDRDLEVWAAGGGTRTTHLRVPLDGVPRLRSAAVTLQQPAYARLEPTVLRLVPGGTPPTAQALAGATLAITLATSRAPAAVQVVHGDDAPVTTAFQATPPTRRGGDATVTLTLADPAPGRWSVVLASPEGDRSPPQAVLQVERRPDLPPEVALRLPEPGALVVAGTPIPIHAEARDDLGLARVTIYRLVDGKQVDEASHTLGGTSDAWRGEVSTATAKPGTTLRLGAVVRDTLPPVGQLSPTNEVEVSIIGLDTYLGLLRDQLNERALLARFTPLFDRLESLEKAVDALAAQPPSPERDTARQRLLDDLAKARADFAEQASTPLFRGDGEVFSALDQRLAALEQAAAAGKPAGEHAAEAMRQDLAAVTAQARADAVEAWLEDLTKAEERMAAEMADLARLPTTSEARQGRLKTLAQEQRDLAQAIAELRDQAAATSEELAPHDRARSERLAGAGHRLAEAQAPAAAASRYADRDRPGSARDAAQETARILAGARAQARGPGEEGEGEGKGQGKGTKPGNCLGKSLGQCRAELAAMAKRSMGQGGSPQGRGGGALGSFGGGRYVRQGGDTPRGPSRQLIGPMDTLSTRNADRSGPGQAKSGTPAPAAPGTDSSAHTPTAYGRDVRTTTAGLGAVLSPGEEAVVDGYFRRLDERTPPPAPGKTP